MSPAPIGGGGGRSPVEPEDVPDVVEAALREAARDGKIKTNELEKAEAKIADKYGPKKAKEVMRRALGVHIDKIDLAAVDYVNGRFGAMGGHVARYQTILVDHLKGAKLLDANFDGKLDAGDKIFTVDARGKVDVKNVGEALRDKLKISRALVDSSEAMDTAGHDFALIKDHKANTKYWKVERWGGTFTLKTGAKPSEAVADMFKNPSKYKFECATALVIVYYKAMLDLLGPKDFDRICGDIRIGPWDYEGDLATHLKETGDSSKPASAAFKKNLKPGDYAYFKNWQVSEEGLKAGWQGENVIYLGGGKYYGHPFGVATGKTIVDHLNTQRKTGATRSASLLEFGRELSPKLLKEDKDPKR